MRAVFGLQALLRALPTPHVIRSKFGLLLYVIDANIGHIYGKFELLISIHIIIEVTSED